MIVVDTSVWIEFFAASESRADQWLTQRIAARSPIVVPELVLMELLTGTTNEPRAAARRHRLQRFDIEPLALIRDSEDAAAIHRKCRRGGDTVRNLIDCQIAAMAMRLDMSVAHRDRDFEIIRTHCGLRTDPLF
jgi:predicted nucleic acid-binding protein